MARTRVNDPLSDGRLGKEKSVAHDILERATARVKQNIWKPHPGPQTFVLTCFEEEILFGGSRGGGKTATGMAWLTRWTHHPELRALVLRRNADDLYDWIDRASRMYAPLGAVAVGKPAEFRFPSGARIRCGHLKDEDAFEKYQGHEYQKMIIEELTQIESEELYMKLLASNRSTVPELRPQMFCTTNPGGAGHIWVKKRWGIPHQPMESIFTFDKGTEHRLIFVPARVTDNPTLMKSDPQYVKFLDGLPPELRKAWRDGRWDIFAGQFFSEWDEQVHVVDRFDIPTSWSKIRTIDPSGRNGNTACYWLTVDWNGDVWIYREYYGTGLDSDQHAENIAKYSEGESYRYTVIDSAAFHKLGLPETTAEIYERHGVNGLIPASKNRMEGWDAVHRYLRHSEGVAPKLRVFRNCPNLIRTLPQMITDEKNVEDIATPRQEDDAADSIRYGLQTFRDQNSAKPMSYTEKRLRTLQKYSKINGISNFHYYR